MENKVIPINLGISYRKDYIFIPKGKINIEGSLFKSKGNGVKVPAGN
jgi:hypothetical protein